MKVDRVGWQDLRLDDRVLIPGAGDGLVEWTMGVGGLHLSAPPRYAVGGRVAALEQACFLREVETPQGAGAS